MDLLKTISSKLDDNALGQIAGMLGTDTGGTRNAVESALPLLIAGLNKNANSGGAADIMKAVQTDHDGSILENLSGFLGQQPSSSDGRIVDHIFGQRRGNIEQQVAQSSGLSGDAVGKLMANLAPVVMGALGSQSKGGGGLSDLVGMLGFADKTARSQPGAGALAGLLDDDGDGVDLGDLAKLGGGLLGGLFKR
ncbi:MAG: DUF937 domain-containing protein [Gammaproteobacteria bacterium]|nr:DUF937 domain-containing protein [Gammaproteobacteria bacterium]